MRSKTDKKVDFDFGSMEPWKETLLSYMGQLLNARLKKKLSQAELAKRMNVKQSVISRFEHAGRIPTFEFLYRVTQALEMNLMITPHGERTIVLSPEQMDTLKRHANRTNTDVYSVVSEMVDSFCNDSYSVDSAEETNPGNPYIVNYGQTSNENSKAACSLD